MKLAKLPRNSTGVITALALAGWFTTASGIEAADKVEDQLNSALIVEWAMGHCDQSRIPAMTAMIAAMTISGADAQTVGRLLEELKGRAAAQYPAT